MSAIIQYKTRAEIDTLAWDQCIARAANGMIYATHLYLDTMATHWDALVLDNYSAVMPLVWRRKWGIYYLYYPSFIPSLGLFGDSLTKELLEAFLAAIPGKFRYWDFPLNHGNLFDSKKFKLSKRTNFILPLNRPYTEIQSAYRENLLRNLQKKKKNGFSLRKDFPVQEVIALAKKFTPSVSLETSTYTRFETMYNLLAGCNQAITYGIFSNKNSLLASAVFLTDRRRAYYILVGNHPDGKTLGASHALIDAFIQDHAGQELLLDFEGSDIRNLAFFYSGFGAEEEYYPMVKHNRLPPLIRQFKK